MNSHQRAVMSHTDATFCLPITLNVSYKVQAFRVRHLSSVLAGIHNSAFIA